MVRGEGARVWNAEGEKFIDGIGGLWFANVGFGRQELTDAATRQLGMLPQFSYFTDIGNPPATELAAKLADRYSATPSRTRWRSSIARGSTSQRRRARSDRRTARGQPGSGPSPPLAHGALWLRG